MIHLTATAVIVVARAKATRPVGGPVVGRPVVGPASPVRASRASPVRAVPRVPVEAIPQEAVDQVDHRLKVARSTMMAIVERGVVTTGGRILARGAKKKTEVTRRSLIVARAQAAPLTQIVGALGLVSPVEAILQAPVSPVAGDQFSSSFVPAHVHSVLILQLAYASIEAKKTLN